MNIREPLHNPFVGLRPFESQDSLYYFGRNQQSKALLRQLHATRFLAVVGSSGSGKSSLIRAGLIPNLEAGFLVQDRDLWQIAVMKPGDTPLYHLAREILQAQGASPTAAEIESFTDMIRHQGAPAVLAQVRSSLDDRDANLLLVVDQFEELFRFSHLRGRSGREEAADFVGILLRLAAQTATPIYVCMTIRSDFLGDCDAFYGLPEAMNRSQYLVPRLTRTQRREAIAGPIRLSGASIAPRLLDRLLNESVDTRDDLPVLQHALMRTWTNWAENGNGPIDMVHYENIRTVKQALSRHAEEALKELSAPDRLIAQRLFQTLTETDAANRRTRRPAHLSEIAAVSAATSNQVMQVMQKFRQDDRNFLVLSSENPADDPLVDISHESLIRQWQTLSDWVDQEAESAKMYRRLAETAELHARGRAGRYREADLQVALDWHKERQPTKAWGNRYHKDFDQAIDFLNQSRAARNRAKAVKIASVVMILIALVFVSCLALQLKEARDNSQRQLARNYWENGQQAHESDEHFLGLHFMAQAIEMAHDLDVARSMVHDLSADLYKIRTVLIVQHEDWVYGALFSPDDQRILTWGGGTTVQLWDVPGDLDFPRGNYVLQVEALSGTRFNLMTRKPEIMSADAFTEAKKAYAKIAREHLKTCQYQRQNIYLHFWGDKHDEPGR